jgi:hypothetical protein
MNAALVVWELAVLLTATSRSGRAGPLSATLLSPAGTGKRRPLAESGIGCSASRRRWRRAGRAQPKGRGLGRR